MMAEKFALTIDASAGASVAPAPKTTLPPEGAITWRFAPGLTRPPGSVMSKGRATQ